MLIVEDGTGLPDANSYAVREVANAYHQLHYGEEWEGETWAQDAALIRATQWLDGTYEIRFPGRRLNGRDQGLAFPRVGAVDIDGNLVEGKPFEVVKATIEAAFREMREPFSLTPDTVAAAAVKSEQVGPIRIEYAIPEASRQPILTVVDHILARLLVSSSSQGVQFLLRG